MAENGTGDKTQAPDKASPPRQLKFSGATAGKLTVRWETEKVKFTTFSFTVQHLPDEVAEELQTLAAYDSAIDVTIAALQNNFMTQGTMLLVNGYTGDVNELDPKTGQLIPDDPEDE
tara:strand:+ start:1768 stop:2118 length:351 start_codon:yes stop_codon:yes gene_type:complete